MNSRSRAWMVVFKAPNWELGMSRSKILEQPRSRFERDLKKIWLRQNFSTISLITRLFPHLFSIWKLVSLSLVNVHALPKPLSQNPTGKKRCDFVDTSSHASWHYRECGRCRTRVPSIWEEVLEQTVGVSLHGLFRYSFLNLRLKASNCWCCGAF
jgi:hypothetical protein